MIGHSRSSCPVDRGRLSAQTHTAISDMTDYSVLACMQPIEFGQDLNLVEIWRFICSASLCQYSLFIHDIHVGVLHNQDYSARSGGHVGELRFQY